MKIKLLDPLSDIVVKVLNAFLKLTQVGPVVQSDISRAIFPHGLSFSVPCSHQHC